MWGMYYVVQCTAVTQGKKKVVWQDIHVFDVPDDVEQTAHWPQCTLFF